MTTFHVDTDAVSTLAANLSAVHDSLQSAKDDIRTGGYGTGSDPVYAALNDFQNGWKDGRKTITEEVANLAKAASGAVAAYEQAENQVIKNAHDGGITTQGAATSGSGK